MSDEKTAIVTGARQGIGAGLVEGFLKAGYNVVGTSRHATALVGGIVNNGPPNRLHGRFQRRAVRVCDNNG